MGTRLGEYVKHTPKPMLEVCGYPFLHHLISKVSRYGFNDFLLLAGYKSEIIEDYFSSKIPGAYPHSVSVNVISEPTQLGTGGALLNALPYLQDDFLLLNGDSFFNIDLREFYSVPLPEDALARIALRQVARNTRYGEVGIDKNRICSFTSATKVSTPCLVNAGIYHLRRNILEYAPSACFSLESQLLPMLAGNHTLTFGIYEDYFIDIGVQEDLERAKKELSCFFQPA